MNSQNRLFNPRKQEISTYERNEIKKANGSVKKNMKKITIEIRMNRNKIVIVSKNDYHGQ